MKYAKLFNLSGSDFEQKFLRCQIDPSDFTHKAHLRLAWININKYGIKQAEISIQNQLQAYVKFIGATNKFNITLTLTAIKAVYHFMQRSSSEYFNDFITEFPRLKYNFKELMDCHYGFDIYNSHKVKKEFLEPDLIPFD